MKKQASDRSRLFFIEFLIVLFFFLIIGTVCLRVFAAAHRVTQDADALAHAQSTAASIAEVLEAGEEIEDYFPEVRLISEDSISEDLDSEKLISKDLDSEGFISEETNGISKIIDGQTNLYEITYDSDFQACDADDAFYTLNLTLTTEDHNQTAQIAIFDRTGDTLYELSVVYHLPLTREEALA
ncbi:MAG: hypothetical protein LUD16_02405 [Lachnospiraceae bacterium]|nr:hypothetical protein [Lachnospiraceae bacterium]